MCVYFLGLKLLTGHLLLTTFTHPHTHRPIHQQRDRENQTQEAEMIYVISM